jgi:hypothetical protein
MGVPVRFRLRVFWPALRLRGCAGTFAWLRCFRKAQPAVVLPSVQNVS